LTQGHSGIEFPDTHDESVEQTPCNAKSEPSARRSIRISGAAVHKVIGLKPSIYGLCPSLKNAQLFQTRGSSSYGAIHGLAWNRFTSGVFGLPKS
jgi:hypothetical protein